MADLWLEVHTKLLHHPKIIATAQRLGLLEAYVRGHLLGLWLGAMEHAEDGDLWRGDEDSTIRFVGILAGHPVDLPAFIEALKADRWLDGWLIHDWLDYTGKYLMDKYKTRQRKNLIRIWAKHGRIYGRNNPDDDGNGDSLEGSDREVGGNQAGGGREVSGNRPGSDASLQHKPLTLHLPETITLNPPTQDPNKRKKPKGGVGENAGIAERGRPKSPDPPPGERAFCISDPEGLRVQGLTTHHKQPCGGFSAKEVFEAFLPVLAFHGITVQSQFHTRIRHCRVSPAEWLMVYLDKVHAVYRDRNGKTLLDNDADPVAMTVAALVPKKGGKPHRPSDAARNLFMEIMVDAALTANGGTSRWSSKTSGPALALELSRRKGKQSKLKITHS